jgi:hypothetical protein
MPLLTNCAGFFDRFALALPHCSQALPGFGEVLPACGVGCGVVGGGCVVGWWGFLTVRLAFPGA